MQPSNRRQDWAAVRLLAAQGLIPSRPSNAVLKVRWSDHVTKASGCPEAEQHYLDTGYQPSTRSPRTGSGLLPQALVPTSEPKRNDKVYYITRWKQVQLAAHTRLLERVSRRCWIAKLLSEICLPGNTLEDRCSCPEHQGSVLRRVLLARAKNWHELIA